MRQVFSAISGYSEDNGGKFPPLADGCTVNSSSLTLNPEYWPNKIESYFKRKSSGLQLQNVNTWRLMRCPLCKLDPGLPDGSGNLVPMYVPGDGYSNNYNFAYLTTMGLNFSALSPIEYINDNAGVMNPQLLSRPTMPSRTVMLVDSQYDADHTFAYGRLFVDVPKECFTLEPSIPQDLGFSTWNYNGWGDDGDPHGWCADRHSSTTNVIWVDGHASSMSLTKLNDPNLWDLH
jgi:prepilin-type processing-associated H-X9-DG protein